eukprot:m.66645 g.66645  ORF g.66645 m.66645 type:complete len:234 (-) comp13769_c0_seq4:1078-1779(-)
MVAVMFLSALVAAIAIVAVVAMLGYAEFRQRFILWQFNTVHKASLLAQGVPYIHDSGFDYHNQHDYFHGDLFDSSGPHLINAINEMHRMQKDGAGVVLTGRAFNGRGARQEMQRTPTRISPLRFFPAATDRYSSQTQTSRKITSCVIRLTLSKAVCGRCTASMPSGVAWRTTRASSGKPREKPSPRCFILVLSRATCRPLMTSAMHLLMSWQHPAPSPCTLAHASVATPWLPS